LTNRVKADVVVENYRPDVTYCLGVDSEGMAITGFPRQS